MTKAKYRLINEFGNRVEYTDSEVEKNILLNRGFHIDEEWQKPAEPKVITPRRRKAAVTDAGKSED